MERNRNYAKMLQPLVIIVSLLLIVFATGLLKPGNVGEDKSKAVAPADDLPVGTIIAWAGKKDTIPENWALCDGKQLRIQLYQELYHAIGTSWGGKGKRFYLPDLRGRFVRGVDGGTGRDQDADNRKASKVGGNKTGVGSVQDDSIQIHAHDTERHKHKSPRGWPDTAVGYAAGPNIKYFSTGLTTMTNAPSTSNTEAEILGPVKYNTKREVFKGEETRPTNAAVYWIIKVK